MALGAFQSMKMKKLTMLLLLFWYGNISIIVAQDANIVTQEWLAKNMEMGHPRLILNPALENKLKEKISNDPLYNKYYQYLKNKAENILTEAPLTYQKTGKRLLSVSRMAIQRMTILALVHKIEKDNKYLKKLEEEVLAVSNFSDWNPSHFLDVAEMSVALAIAIDWCGEYMDADTKKIAINALVENGLKPGLAVSEQNWWVDVHHNWNLVCHAGLSMGALAVWEQEPEIASYILNRAVEKIPNGLIPYAPDGVYPEGPSYWMYATSYLTMIISSFESTLHTDFNLTNAEGVMESAMYTRITAGPSGDYFNFFDARKSGYQSMFHLGLLSWFSNRGGLPFNRKALEKIFENPEIVSTENNRFAVLYFLYLIEYEDGGRQKQISEDEAGKTAATDVLPKAWVGLGENPIGVLRANDETGVYLAAKGGRAADNHGNMDAGSFIFEWQKIRWSVDLGMQNYYELEETIGNAGLWNIDQDSKRWTLLSKNNFGHSTLTVNEENHIADARSFVIDKELDVEQPSITFDITPVFGENIKKAERTFQKVSNEIISITDSLEFSTNTKTITWQMMTLADVKEKKDGFELSSGRHKMLVKVLNKEKYKLNIVSLSPPPLAYDMNVPNLKRLEIKFKKSDLDSKGSKLNIILEGIK